jgi:DNA-binding MarR family transcriptional regulator
MGERGQALEWLGSVGEATDAASLGERIRALARAHHAFNISVARALGLAPNDVWALEHLLADGPLGPAELARRLAMTTASATVLLDRLEAAGHVERRPHPTDRRRLSVAPTEQADRDAYRAIAPFVKELDAAEAALTPEEREAVARYLDRITAALTAFAASGPKR